MKKKICFVMSLSFFIIAVFTGLLRFVSPDYCKLDFAYGCFFNKFLAGLAIVLILMAVICFLCSRRK